QGSRAADERVAVPGQLELERRVGLGLMPDALQLLEGGHQCLGDVLSAVGAKPAADRVGKHPHLGLSSATRTACTKARTFAGSLTRTRASTPLDTSTPYGLRAFTTVPTLPGSSPPAMKTRRRAVGPRARSQSHVLPVPPRW